jgi:hypothetical protein
VGKSINEGLVRFMQREGIQGIDGLLAHATQGLDIPPTWTMYLHVYLEEITAFINNFGIEPLLPTLRCAAVISKQILHRRLTEAPVIPPYQKFGRVSRWRDSTLSHALPLATEDLSNSEMTRIRSAMSNVGIVPELTLVERNVDLTTVRGTGLLPGL